MNNVSILDYSQAFVFVVFLKKIVMRKILVGLLLMIVSASCEAQVEKFAKIPALKPQQKKAYFASGCFWCVEGVYERVQGVDAVISGYAAGAMKNPSYYNHGNHTETVLVIYDSTKVSYTQLVGVFFEITNPYTVGQAPDFGASYRTAVFPKEGNQQTLIMEQLKRYPNHKIDVVPFANANFHPAENYHQDYVRRLEAGEQVVNRSYGINVSIPRRNDFVRATKIPLKKQ